MHEREREPERTDRRCCNDRDRCRGHPCTRNPTHRPALQRSARRGVRDGSAKAFTAERWARLEALADQFHESRSVAVRLVDDRINDAVATGIRQIVMLGAGLDSRAFRMDLPSDLVLFEIDLPDLFAFKEPVLAGADASPTCKRSVIAVDLQQDWTNPLRRSGFDPDAPTLWVDEGVLGYLTPEGNRRVVAELTELSAPGSRFGVSRYAADLNSSRYQELRSLVDEGASHGSLSADDIDIQRWLTDLGWEAEFRSWNQQVAHLDRAVSISDPDAGHFAAVRR